MVFIVPVQSNSKQNQLVADTGATHHFLQHNNNHDYIHTAIPVLNITPTSNGIDVLLPNNATMHSTHTGQLDIPALPPEAKTAHIFTELASGSLLSIGQLCDHGCSAYFNKAKLYILYKGNIIMQGSRGPTKLWTIDQPATTVHALNSVIDAPTIAERLKFYTVRLF